MSNGKKKPTRRGGRSRRAKKDNQTVASNKPVTPISTKCKSEPPKVTATPKVEVEEKPEVYRLTVTVVDHKGRAVPGATVNVTDQPATPTTELGKAVFDLESAGSVTVTAQKAGYSKKSEEDWETQVDVEDESAAATRTLQKDYKLTVTVVDHKGAAVPGATVEVSTQEPKTTGDLGQADFVLPDEGDYTASAKKENYAQKTGEDWKAVIHVADTTAAATRTLQGMGTLAVEVYDETVAASRDTAPLLKGPTVGLEGAAKISGPAPQGTVSAKIPADSEHELTADFKGCLAKAVEKKVKVETGKTTTVKLYLKFPKLFIVGGGEKFDYEKKLATKYATNPRKWVLVSQYDVTKFEGTPPDNLLVYRDSSGFTPPYCKAGAFSVTDSRHWTKLVEVHGADFEATIFNNPHAGHGLPKQEVLGVSQQYTNQGRLITNTISYGAYGYLGNIPDYSSGARKELAKKDVWEPVYAEQDDSYITHYEVKKETMGLNEFLLWCYSWWGKDCLRSGGTLEVNGPPWVADYLPKYGLSGDDAFTDSPYYVSYTSNLTSTTPHPSWGSQPRAHSRPENMTRWKKTKS